MTKHLYCDDFIAAGLHSMDSCCASCHYEMEDGYDFAGCETEVEDYLISHCCSLVISTDNPRNDIAKVLWAKRRKNTKND